MIIFLYRDVAVMEVSVNTEIKARINELREQMKKNKITYYLVVTADPHLSEYINDSYKERQFLSGFTGSNGTLLVGTDEAYLWTDGRYFVQAQKELEGTDICLMRSLNAGVPTIEQFLDEHLQSGDILGFDGTLISYKMGMRMEKTAAAKGAIIIWDINLVNAVWKDRPVFTASPIRILADEITGESATNKLGRVREYLNKCDADWIFISKLDDVMWLYNIRANDIECNPVAYSYSLIGRERAIVAFKSGAANEQVVSYFEAMGVEVVNYDMGMKLFENIKSHNKDCLGDKKCKILLDGNNVTFAAGKTAEKYGATSYCPNVTEAMKAVKNDTEVKNIREYYLKDSAVLTRFLMYMKERGAYENISESKAAAILDGMRAEIPGFFELSFPTISAYGPNAAMMHYEAYEGKDAVIKPQGIYLVDSGGQYDGATTDVTRSIFLGDASEEMKNDFTRVAMGMLRLQSAVFLKGCAGRNLDILAREPLWECDIDYKCGTGHGIGYILNVHEGPQSIRWAQSPEGKETVFESGMIVSDEPGVYKAGKYGIRTENILLCREKTKNDDGQFMCFEPLTFVPIDLDGINPDIMDKSDIDRLNKYHAMCREKLSPYMNDEEKIWLQKATREIKNVQNVQ